MEITGYAFVTGGASGIGRACCLAFAKEGAKGLIVADINLEGARETANQAKVLAKYPEFRVDVVRVDISVEESVMTAVAHAVKYLGRIDYAVHSASIPGGTFDPIAEASFADIKRLLDVSVNGTFLFTSLVSAVMKTQERRQASATDPTRGTTRGSIVNLSSVSEFMAVSNMVQYTTCKHAISGITKTAALDNAPLGIRVNCVCPTWTDTPMTRRATDVAPGLEKALLATMPLGRLGRPEEAADAAIFLCSARSSFTTGTSLVLDGGMTLSC
ncbi:hypothetical protein INS49_004658 [Diaporthe citri]|uniref:uncharacterized protein n=1 Tax=Diaporthe citri TaxID=83186 RepID=UPI001C7EF3DD|nr:uncharacterized protein INS49_004658 [Diaporthe citri]KAG6354640.1 hypothetical protein INS49_004658 [Diaporthe citri]